MDMRILSRSVVKAGVWSGLWLLLKVSIAKGNVLSCGRVARFYFVLGRLLLSFR